MKLKNRFNAMYQELPYYQILIHSYDIYDISSRSKLPKLNALIQKEYDFNQDGNDDNEPDIDEHIFEENDKEEEEDLDDLDESLEEDFDDNETMENDEDQYD